MSTNRSVSQWPPRSPREALLSSPTGRQKIRQYRDRTSPSPSPLKKSSTLRAINEPRRASVSTDAIDSDQEEDEETLQLQLAAIEAKIKLRRLREKTSGNAPHNTKDGAHRNSRPRGKENTLPSFQSPSDTTVRTSRKPGVSEHVQIEVSPQRKPVVVEEAKSPGRVFLGIDKGLKGRNISLRRPVEEHSRVDDPFKSNPSLSYLARAQTISRDPSTADWDRRIRPKSFSDKVAETRQQEKALKERAKQQRKQRGIGFGVSQQEIKSFQSPKGKESIEREESSKAVPSEYSRDEILEARTKADRGQVHRSNTSSGIRRSRATPSTDIWLNPNVPPVAPSPPIKGSNAAKKRSCSLSPETTTKDSPSHRSNLGIHDCIFEPFSSVHLSKRLLPHDVLTRTFSGKHIYLLPDLLGAVRSPKFELPDFPETDYVVLAIIASKSFPLNHKGVHKSTAAESTSLSEAADSEQNTNGKYMVLTLTNLKWTMDLFLFATGFTRFRKITPGTVIALLNPEIMPPPPGKADTGRFSLKLSSSDDTLLELGTSRDLGWCRSLRKDGKQCETWIDKRHTEFCEFHVDIGIERTRRGRMEVQGMSAPFAPGGRKGGRTGHFGDKRQDQNPMKGEDLDRQGPKYDRGSGSRYFVASSMPGQSTAQLLDAEGAADRYGSKEDRMRRRLAEREKENEIARKLGKGGNGAGSQYLRMKQGLGAVPNAAKPQAVDPLDVATLGLFGNRARNVHLSPIKKRKGGSTENEGVRKKTRFMTEAGIQEAGRESFGADFATCGRSDDDDDGLEVI